MARRTAPPPSPCNTVKESVTDFLVRDADIPTLLMLKRIDHEWGGIARVGIESMTCLDAHLLHRAGRMWQVPLAIRQLPFLRELHWGDFVADLVGLQEVEDPCGCTPPHPLLNDARRAALCQHITSERGQEAGEPPVELLLCACSAVSGSFGGLPIAIGEMRNKPIEELVVPFAHRTITTDFIPLLLPCSLVTTMRFGRNALPVKLLKGISVDSLKLVHKHLPALSAFSIASLLGVSQLTSIDLSNNCFGDLGMCAIFDALRNNPHNKMNELKLSSSCNIAELKRCEMLMTSLKSYIASSGSLTSLDLSHNEFANGLGWANCAKMIGEGLAANRSLTFLDVRYNHLGDEGWCAIFDALRDNPENKIKKWALDNQRIGPKIAKSLAAYIARSGSLTSLDLSFNCIGESAKAIGEALIVNNSLTSLDLAYGCTFVPGSIPDFHDISASIKEAALSLLNALKAKDQLRTADLRGCVLDADGAKAASAYASDSRSLTSVRW